MENVVNSKNESTLATGFSIGGMDWKYFGAFAVIVFAAMYMGALPKGMIGAFPLMMVIGAVLGELGNRTPIVKDYFGGGPIVIIFGTAALCMTLIPEASQDIMINFIKGEGFLTFAIAGLITGSILGMDRDLLIKAAVRFFPTIFGGLVVSFLLVGVGGMLIGYGFADAITYIGIPIMGGGMGAGAVPISEIFSQAMGTEPTEVLSRIVPALALGNAMAIVVAGFLNKLGKMRPSLSGEGQLIADDHEIDLHNDITNAPMDYKKMGIGILLATAFLALGRVLGQYVPVHYYAMMIISVAIAKAFNVIPKPLVEACYQWYQFVIKNFIPVVLVGIGAAYTDLNAIVNAISVQYVFLVFLTVLGAAIGAGIVGKLLGFYFIESALTAGLCMANMGGSGDVAVLGAAKRMELMPFAQISSRLGGAVIILIATFLIQIIV